jgi:xanthine/uracil/vitamin C permease (AzgA family)
MSSEASSHPRKAGVFDLRLIIALLIGVYGVVLTIMGIGFTTAAEIAKAAGVNINLWAGIGMLVVAVLFILWARLRPLIVLPPSESVEDTTADTVKSE